MLVMHFYRHFGVEERQKTDIGSAMVGFDKRTRLIECVYITFWR
jgi:hypothetical protein